MQKSARSFEYCGGFLYKRTIENFSTMYMTKTQKNPRGKSTGIPGPNKKQSEQMVINSE